MSIDCYNCGHSLSEKARFCSACKAQVRCKSCGEDLEANALACQICGEDVLPRDIGAPTLNRIKFTEDKKGRTFEAEFTDRVGESIGGTFAALLSKNSMSLPIRQVKPVVPSNQGKFNYAEDVEAENSSENEEPSLQLPAPVEIHPETTSKSSTSEALKSLFEHTDDGWILEEPELKALNKGDFMKRVTCLFLYFQHEQGLTPVPRQDVLAMLHHCGVYDGTVRRWFREEKSLIHATAKDLKLKLPGTQRAKEILSEMINAEIPSGWKIGTKGKGGRKAGSKKEKLTQPLEE